MGKVLLGVWLATVLLVLAVLPVLAETITNAAAGCRSGPGC